MGNFLIKRILRWLVLVLAFAVIQDGGGGTSIGAFYVLQCFSHVWLGLFNNEGMVYTRASEVFSKLLPSEVAPITKDTHSELT